MVGPYFSLGRGTDVEHLEAQTPPGTARLGGAPGLRAGHLGAGVVAPRSNTGEASGVSFQPAAVIEFAAVLLVTPLYFHVHLLPFVRREGSQLRHGKRCGLICASH